MVALTRHITVILLSLAIQAVLTTASLGSSQNDSEEYVSSDTVFREIVLTEEGVTAIDTSGHEWYYDFEYSTFVVGFQPLPDEGADFDGISDMPIEERAVIQKKVKHFEMGSVTVRPDEYVDGDIKALDMVTVKGWVKGDVISLRDRVFITETGRVDGNVQAPRVIRKEGGEVYGEITETFVPIELKDITSGFSHEFLLVMSIITASFLFVGFIMLAIMPRQIANIESCIVQNKPRSFVLGFLIVLVMPAIVVLLAITIVGVVLIPILPFVYFWAVMLGFVATGKGLAEIVRKKFLGGIISPILLGIVGIILLMIPWLLTGALMGSADDTTAGFGVFFLVVSIVITLFPVFSGIGASFLTRFGFRGYVSGRPFRPRSSRPSTASPAPPPIPDAPFVQKPETPESGSRISEEK
jgi:hypothetical protein